MNELPKFQDAWEVQPIPVAKRSENDFLYATHISDRWPRFKVHRTVGHAHAALAYRYSKRLGALADMIFYRKAGDEWIPVQAWRTGEQARPEWWEPEPDPQLVRSNNRAKNFERAKADIEAVINDPEARVPELVTYQEKLSKTFRRVTSRINDIRNENEK